MNLFSGAITGELKFRWDRRPELQQEKEAAVEWHA